MLSLVFFFSLFILLKIWQRFFPFKKTFRIVSIIILNILIIELLAYGCLLYQISRGGSFVLIGNQTILDRLLKNHLVSRIHAQDDNPYSHYRIDQRLGYSIGINKYYFQYKVTNSFGMRADHEYSFIPNRDTFRIAAFGDSFVYCDGEITQNCWTYILEKSIDNLEVLNFGVSGYGLGQSYLRYLNDGIQFNPDIIFFNYVQTGQRDRVFANEIILDNTLTKAHHYRPHFKIEDGALVSENTSPIKLFDPAFRQEYIYKPLGVVEEELFFSNKIFSFSNLGLVVKQVFMPKVLSKYSMLDDGHNLRVNIVMLKNLLDLARENNSTILFFCHEPFPRLPAAIQSLLKDSQSYIEYVHYGTLFDAYFKSRDLNREDFLNETSHFNQKGNQIYAQIIAHILTKRSWGHGPRVFQFDQTEGRFINLGSR